MVRDAVVRDVSPVFALGLSSAVVSAVRSTWSPCGLSMLSTLTPFAERARGHRFWLTAVWFVAGATAGGLALGALAALPAMGFGRLAVPTGLTLSAVAACAAICLASDSGAAFHLPLRRRQVDETWLGTYRRWVYASAFGVQIGVGLATYVMTAAVYLTIAIAVLTGSGTQAVAVCALFGFVRGLAILFSVRALSFAATQRLHRRFHDLAEWSRRSALASIAAVFAVAVLAMTPMPPLLLLAVPLALICYVATLFTAALRVRSPEALDTHPPMLAV